MLRTASSMNLKQKKSLRKEIEMKYLNPVKIYQTTFSNLKSFDSCKYIISLIKL